MDQISPVQRSKHMSQVRRPNKSAKSPNYKPSIFHLKEKFPKVALWVTRWKTFTTKERGSHLIR